MTAQQAVEAAETRQAAAAMEFQNSAAARLLGGDPAVQVGKLLRGSTAERDMAQLAAATAHDPEARAGLQRTIADMILRDMKGDQATTTGAETQLKAARLQEFVRKSSPALRQVMTDRQVQTLLAVADDLQRSSLSGSGTRAPGAGSDTIQNRGAQSLGRSLMQETGRSISGATMGGGATLGYVAGGPLGAVLGGMLGTGPLVGRAMAAARAAGLNTVDDLVREAMLNPALAHVLLARVKPANQATLATSMAAALGKASLLPAVGGAGPVPQRQKAAPLPRPALSNALLDGVAAAPPPPARNILFPDGVR